MPTLVIGAIVHYVMPDGVTHRPAMVITIYDEATKAARA